MKSFLKSHSRQIGLLWIAITLIVACKPKSNEADAYGNFEADEVIVSAQMQGVLLSLEINEGVHVDSGSVIGHIDSASAVLKKEQLAAQQSVIRARLRNIDAQISVQDEQRINLEREVNRMESLLKDNAATQQQFDDIAGKLNVLNSQTEAILSQKNIIKGEQSVIYAQLDEVKNMLDKCLISSPVSGVILEKYVNAGELVTPGKALFKVADTDEMELRVFISGSQLSSVKSGDTVNVRIDGPEDLQTIPGTISWIASQVEFTPKIIQTREERVNMVYAVKIRVKNDGRLKIGMPGEVVWRR